MTRILDIVIFVGTFCRHNVGFTRTTHTHTHTHTQRGFHVLWGLVLSKDPVLRYQVGTKKMKTSRYQVSLSPGGTEYPVNPVLAALSESCADALAS